MVGWLKSAVVAGTVGVSASAGYLIAAQLAPAPPPPPPPEVRVVTVYRDRAPEPPPGDLIENLDLPAVTEAKRFRVRPAPAPALEAAPEALPESPLAAITEAIPLGSTGADALVARALAAAERGDYPRAWRALDKALRRDPDHAIAHLLAGVLSQMQGDVRRARQEYGEYLLREPLGTQAAEVRKVLAAR